MFILKKLDPQKFLRWGNNHKTRVTSWALLGIILTAVIIIGISLFGDKWNTILTAEEKLWLDTHPEILFAPDPNFPPLEYFDEDGEYKGLVADYFMLIQKKLGIDIKIVRLASWNDVLSQAESRKVDGITAAQITPERLKYLSYTTPIVDIPNVLITQKVYTNSLSLEDMEGWTIAITEGNAMEEYVRKNYPYITIKPVKSDLEALEWVSFDRADATTVNLAIASYLIDKHGFTNLRIAGDSDRSNPLAIAIRSDEPILKNIIQKGLNSISDSEKNEIYDKWVGLSGTGSVFTSQVLSFIFWALAGLAIFIFVSIFWNMSLQTQVNQKTGELNRELAERKKTEAKLNQQLANISALRTVNSAINASMDLQLTLNILLDQVSSKLQVDACDVLLLNPYTRSLDYAADRGFRTPYIRGTSLNRGDSFAWQAIQNRKIILIDDLKGEPGPLNGSLIQESEGFISYIGAPLISKGNIKGILEIFHRDRLDHEEPWMDFLESMVGQAAIALDNSSMFEDLQRANLDLTLAYDATIEGWARALELKDGATEGHSQRVTQLTLDLASRLGIDDSDLVHIRRGALLHDIGKMGIPDSILRKPGKLSEEEWNIMRKHPIFARDMLKNISYLQPIVDIPYCHHERWDGNGYPQGLPGPRIPLPARIFSVIDVWDALSSDRPYRGPWPEHEVFKYIKENSGTQFDPRVVEEFFILMNR